jgi:hypothetical protein
MSNLGQTPTELERAPPPPQAGRAEISVLRRQFRRLPTVAKWIVAVILSVFVFFALVWILWQVERHLLSPIEAARAPTAVTRPHFWIQVFAGKWAPNSVPYASTTFPFALSAVLALVLSVAPFIATITLIYLYLIRPVIKLGKEQTMKLEQYNKQRDEVIIGEIYSLLPLEKREELIRIVEQGFRQGSQAMDNEFLAIPYTERGAREFVRRLNEIDVT